MTDALSSRLLEAIEKVEVDLRELARDPYDGLTDDERHDRRAHRAYEYATTHGGRKTWDGSDTPPPGQGWERNITKSDPDGWERFEYHEESYWRRLRPDGPEPWQPPERVRLGLGLCQAHREIVEHWTATKHALTAAEGTILAGACRVRLGAYDNALKALARAYCIEVDDG